MGISRGDLSSSCFGRTAVRPYSKTGLGFAPWFPDAEARGNAIENALVARKHQLASEFTTEGSTLGWAAPLTLSRVILFSSPA